MGKLNTGLISIVLAVVVGLIVIFFAAYLFAPDATRVKDVLWGMQAGVTALAVILGGFFATYKWQVFSEYEPHLTITHEVSHRPRRRKLRPHCRDRNAIGHDACH